MGTPRLNRLTAPGEKPGAHLRKAGESGKVLDFQHFSC